MAFSRESLNEAVSLKLADIDQASWMHRSLFAVTQVGGVAGAVGAVLVAPLALEVAAITAGAGLAFYGISQLIQTKRTGRFLPLPGVAVSAEQLAYLPSALVAQLMRSAAPEAPEDVRLLPADWLPQRERRLNYLLTHCADLLIGAAENAQDGISFAAIVDTAVRASEYAITDAQISNPVIAPKMAGDVRALLQGDTSRIEAKQTQAIAAEYQRAQAELAAGVIDADEFAAVEAQVRLLAPDALALPAADGAIDVEAELSAAPTSELSAEPLAANANAAGERHDWREVFGLVADQGTYPAIAVLGAQGFGKTTLVNYLLSVITREKIVLDPHYQMGAWPGCLVIGAGMNYAAVGEALANISVDVKERYLQRATVRGYQAAPVTLVLEEQTNWAAKVPGAAQFVKESLSDIRKVGYQTITVAHGATNTARGGGSGTRAMRDQGELQITLLDRGLAEVSIKGREKFKLRFPNPEPYTVNTGEPVIAQGGDIGQGDRSEASRAAQQTIEAAPAAPVAPTKSKLSDRELLMSIAEDCRGDDDGSAEVIGWLLATGKDSFSPRQARGNKKLRHLTTDQVRAAFDSLVEGDWLATDGDDNYRLAQPL